MSFFVDISTAAGRVGPGPLRTATSWSNTRRLDRAGEVGFTVPAADERTALIQSKRVATCKALRDGALVEIGAGIIDSIGMSIAADGGTMLDLGGNDLLKELAHVSVGFLQLTDGAGGPSTTALADILALAPAGWSLDLVNGYASTLAPVYFEFAGESVLAALCKIAQVTGEHFRLGVGRSVVWIRKTYASSGVRAVHGGDPVALAGNPDVALITSLSRVRDSHELATRVYPFGAGNAEARLTLADTTRTAPTGYTLDLVNNCLINDAAEATYGRIEKYLSMKDVAQLASGTTSAASAADQLFDAAYEWLRTHCAPLEAYSLSVTKLDRAVEPGQLIRVIYRDVVDDYVAIDINAELLVLEAQTQIDNQGTRTVGLTVSTLDRWPGSGDARVAEAISTVSSMEAHLQPAAQAATVFDADVARLSEPQTFTAAQTFAAPVTLTNRLTLPRRLVTADTTVASGDYLIGVGSRAVGVIITLPTAVGQAGRQLVIKDESGQAALFDITVEPGVGGQLIDGSSAMILDDAYEALCLYSNGASWFTW